MLPNSKKSLQATLDALNDWGKKWRIRFDPTKSQLMTIAHQRHRWPIMDLTFGDHTVSELSEVNLLGITFDSGLSFKTHLHNTALKANSRLRFLRKAARVLDGAGKRTICRGFVGQVLEYAPLVWMGAASGHLRLLDRVQRRALHILGPDVLLQSLAARRLVATLSYNYVQTDVSGRATANNVAGSPSPTPHSFLHQHVLELDPITRCATSLSYRTSSRLPLLIMCDAASPTASLTSGTICPQMCCSLCHA